MSTRPSACLVIIGNEILSGRTQDSNLAWIAKGLNDIGIGLTECRVIPDVADTIVKTINACRAQFDYVFTTGGIGPTHDDITTENIARAFGVSVIRHPDAQRALTDHYQPDQLNAARLKMADVPQGATLIANPVSAAPGYYVENVFVMAGVPRIMQAMFDNIKPLLRGGAKMHSRTVSAYITEGNIAAPLASIQDRFPDVEIGSYPFIRGNRLGTSLVARGIEIDALDACMDAIEGMLKDLKAEIIAEPQAANA